MKAAIYCRLSKEDEDCSKGQNKESESIQNQKSMLIAYAMEHSFEIYQIYSDEDYSGVDRGRPAFNEMIEAAREHKFDIILAKTQSRFTRDMELVEKYLHGKFIEWGIRFIAVVDHVDTDDAASKKSRQINGLVNEWYLEDLSDNVRSVLLQKRREGKYIATFALYGYQKDPQDKNHVLVDLEAAEVVKRIFALYLTGCGATRIAALLNAENIPNPTLYKQQHGTAYVNANAYGKADGLWARSTIYGMLRNETYAGNLVQGRHRKVSYKSRKTVTLPQDQWIVVRGTHEPIIDEESFRRVQQMLAQRGKGGKSGMIHPLAGKVRCGVCRACMERTGGGIAGKSGARNMYLRCRTHSRKHDACIQNSIPVEDVEEIVLERIRQHVREWFDPEAMQQAALDTEKDKRDKANRCERGRLQKKLEKRTRAMQNLYLDKSAGLLDNAQYLELNSAFEADREKLQKRISQLDKELGQGASPEMKREEWLQQVRQIADLQSLTREIVLLLVERIYVYGRDAETGRREIEIFWNF
jgi:site-specific DNA recombinase